MRNTIKTFGLMLTAATLAFAPAAFAADVSAENQGKYEAKDNGGYVMKGTSSETMKDGTEKSAEVKVDVDVDSDGKMTKTSKKETTTNPEGLLNERTNLSKTELKETARGGYEKKTVDKKTNADGTDVKTEASVDVDVDSDGKTVEKRKVVKTVDPKGLLNQEKTIHTSKKVDGKIVEEKTER